MLKQFMIVLHIYQKLISCLLLCLEGPSTIWVFWGWTALRGYNEGSYYNLQDQLLDYFTSCKLCNVIQFHFSCWTLISIVNCRWPSVPPPPILPPEQLPSPKRVGWEEIACPLGDESLVPVWVLLFFNRGSGGVLGIGRGSGLGLSG